ncbi:hypothetical protein ACWD3Z_47120 [Streptomyces sp. NPDC002740]
MKLTVKVFFVVAPMMTGLPPFTTTFEIVVSPLTSPAGSTAASVSTLRVNEETVLLSSACAAGTARAEMARAPVTAATEARMRMCFPTSEKGAHWAALLHASAAPDPVSLWSLLTPLIRHGAPVNGCAIP